MLSSRTKKYSKIASFVLLAISIILGWAALLTSHWVLAPKTDVVGGSSLYGTHTVQYVVSVVLALGLSGFLGLIVNLNQLPKRILGISVNIRSAIWENRKSKKIVNELEQLPNLLILFFTLLILSKHLTYYTLAAFKDKSELINHPLGTQLSLANTAILIFCYFAIAAVVFIAYQRQGFYSASATFITLSAIPLMVLSLTHVISEFSTKDLQLPISITIFIILVFIAATGKLIAQNKITPERIRTGGIYAGLFVLVAKIPKSPGTLNYFEDYPYLNVHAYLNWNYQPWSGLQLNHGLYHDFLRPLLGSLLIDNSVWGMQTGITFILFPLEICLVLFLTSKILDSKFTPLYLFLALVALSGRLPSEGANSWFFLYSLPRALPLLFCTYLLKLIIQKSTYKRIIGLGICNAIAIIWAAESLIIALLHVIALIYFFVVSSTETMRTRALKVVVLISLTLGLPSGVLTILGFAKAFLSDYEGLTSNLVQGSLDFNFKAGIGYSAFVLGLPILFCAYIFRLGMKLKSKLSDLDLVFLPSMIVGVYYYIKFLAWPDLHIQQSVNALSILWCYAALLMVKEVSRFRESYRTSKILFVGMVTASLLASLSPNRAILPRIEGEYLKEFGIVNSDFVFQNNAALKLKNQINSMNINTRPVVLDLSNAPVDINLVAGFRFVPDLSFSSFYVAQNQQRNAISQISKYQPDIVVLSGPQGLSNGVFPGEIYQRNYLIARYIFSRYQHLTEFENYRLLTKGPANLTNSNIRSLLPENYLKCDWGRALNVVPDLSRDSIDSKKISNLILINDGVPSSPISLKRIRGFFVEVNGGGNHIIEESGSNLQVKFKTEIPEGKKTTSSKYFVPVDSCPAWSLNSSTVGTFNIKSSFLKINGALVSDK